MLSLPRYAVSVLTMREGGQGEDEKCEANEGNEQKRDAGTLPPPPGAFPDVNNVEFLHARQIQQRAELAAIMEKREEQLQKDPYSRLDIATFLPLKPAWHTPALPRIEAFNPRKETPVPPAGPARIKDSSEGQKGKEKK